MTVVATELALQRCIESDCGAQYGLNQQLYICPLCGGLLEIETKAIADADALRNVWETRLSSPHEKDRRGVLRYRELFPFPDGAPIASLAGGKTSLFDR